MSRFRAIWLCSLLMLALWCGGTALALDLTWPQPSAAAAAVIEAESGQIIFAAEGDTPLPPASTAKIITALLVLDMAEDMNETVTVSSAAAAVGESSLYLRVGEQLTLAELLTGALLHSGNDACFALAEAVAGSEPLFVHWLNLKCALLGADSAHLCNTNGLPDAEHVISALDLARLTACAMRYDFFAATVASRAASLGSGNSYRYYRNTNKLLWQDERIVGVKTGTTDDAGKCLVAALKDGAATYISVVFDCADRYGQSYRLLDYAAAHYARLYPVCTGRALAVYQGQRLYAAEDVSFFMREEDRESVRVVWELPYRVRFVGADGRELACCALTAHK